MGRTGALLYTSRIREAYVRLPTWDLPRARRPNSSLKLWFLLGSPLPAWYRVTTFVNAPGSKVSKEMVWEPLNKIG